MPLFQSFYLRWHPRGALRHICLSLMSIQYTIVIFFFSFLPHTFFSTTPVFFSIIFLLSSSSIKANILFGTSCEWFSSYSHLYKACLSVRLLVRPSFRPPLRLSVSINIKYVWADKAAKRRRETEGCDGNAKKEGIRNKRDGREQLIKGMIRQT